MPKMKTNRGAAKRFRRTGSGKVVHKKAWGGHYFHRKTKPHRTRVKGNKVVSKADERQVRTLLNL